jgi:transposase, IS6 family
VHDELGFGTFYTAQRTIQGYKAMIMLRKGWFKGMPMGDILAQNQVANQMFGLAA